MREIFAAMGDIVGYAAGFLDGPACGMSGPAGILSG